MQLVREEVICMPMLEEDCIQGCMVFPCLVSLALLCDKVNRMLGLCAQINKMLQKYIIYALPNSPGSKSSLPLRNLRRLGECIPPPPSSRGLMNPR